MPGGFSILLGGEPMDDEDPEREAAKAALKRFRGADVDVALEAFLSLCEYAKGMHGDEKDKKDMGGDEGGY